jgi:hypothetical protein
MKMLWKDEVKRDRILLFVTDVAPNMLKAAKGLKMLYPRMVHLLFVADGLHNLQSQQAIGRRPSPQTARPLGSAVCDLGSQDRLRILWKLNVH